MARRMENIAHNFERIGAILDDEHEPIGSDSDLSEISDEEDSEYVDSEAEKSPEDSEEEIVEEPLTPPVDSPLQVAGGFSWLQSPLSKRKQRDDSVTSTGVPKRGRGRDRARGRGRAIGLGAGLTKGSVLGQLYQPRVSKSIF